MSPKRHSTKRRSVTFKETEKKSKTEDKIEQNGSSDKEIVVSESNDKTPEPKIKQLPVNKSEDDELSDDIDDAQSDDDYSQSDDDELSDDDYEYQSKKSSKKRSSKKSSESEKSGTPGKVLKNNSGSRKVKTSDSFTARRKFILDEDDPPSVLDVKNKYPFLFHGEKVLAEYEMIMKKKYIYENFKRNVSRYHQGIWQLVSSPIKVKVQSFMKDVDEMTKMWLKKVASLLLISEYLDDDRNGIMVFDGQTIPDSHDNRPYIKCNGDIQFGHEHKSSFVIIVEGIELCHASNMVEAYFSLIAAYYIFNAVYPSCSENTFYFLEKYYLDYPDNYSLVNSKTKKRMDELIAGSVENKE